MSLVKTAELEPSKGYVFGFHPHGIISMSAFVAFATEGLQVSKTFPGECSTVARPFPVSSGLQDLLSWMSASELNMLHGRFY
jgi:hypothetical protein